MIKKLSIFLLLELLSISILTGCRTAEHDTDPSFKNFDVEYTINDDGPAAGPLNMIPILLLKILMSSIRSMTTERIHVQITPTNIRLKFPESKENCRLPLLY